MGLYDRINEDIKQSMKSKAQQRLDVLRMMKTKIMTVDARGNLPEDEIIKILSTYEKNLKDAFDLSQSSGRVDALADLETEMAIVREYLPQKLSAVETEALVQQAIQDTGATSKKEMGLVMKKVMASGQVLDGALVKQCVDKLLH